MAHIYPTGERILITRNLQVLSKKGGGVLLDLSHELDYLRWIFGDFKIKYVINKKFLI